MFVISDAKYRRDGDALWQFWLIALWRALKGLIIVQGFILLQKNIASEQDTSLLVLFATMSFL